MSLMVVIVVRDMHSLICNHMTSIKHWKYVDTLEQLTQTKFLIGYLLTYPRIDNMIRCQQKVFKRDNKRMVIRECRRHATKLFTNEIGTLFLCHQHLIGKFLDLKKAISGYKQLALFASKLPSHV